MIPVSDRSRFVASLGIGYNDTSGMKKNDKG